LDDRLAARAADAVLTDAQPLRDNAYKVPLARELVRRALLRLAGL
ncbi:MAG: FAD binding domain-containing protein, partial [Candidatus Limnocylindria bacterium]